MKLKGVVALALGVGNDSGSHDLDVACAGAVATSHLRVHLADGTVEGGLTVLLVHVVDTRARVVAKPDSEVLDLVGLLLVDLLNSKKLATSRLGLAQRAHVVPESRLGNNLVAGEDLHPKDLRGRVLGGRSRTTHNLVQTDVLLHTELSHL